MSLFNNPMIDAAKNAMSHEQLEEYKSMGRYMYNTVDFEAVKKEPDTVDLVSYAIDGIKSGLDPKDLSDEEIRALIDTYGNKWYKKYGFKKKEIREPYIQIFTKNKKK
jgi:hypothetical protein